MIESQNRLSRIVCTSNEIEILVGLLNPNKATGPDEISNKMLKAVAKEISIPLNILFNSKYSFVWRRWAVKRG